MARAAGARGSEGYEYESKRPGMLWRQDGRSVGRAGTQLYPRFVFGLAPPRPRRRQQHARRAGTPTVSSARKRKMKRTKVNSAVEFVCGYGVVGSFTPRKAASSL